MPGWPHHWKPHAEGFVMGLLPLPLQLPNGTGLRYGNLSTRVAGNLIWNQKNDRSEILDTNMEAVQVERRCPERVDGDGTSGHCSRSRVQRLLNLGPWIDWGPRQVSYSKKQREASVLYLYFMYILRLVRVAGSKSQWNVVAKLAMSTYEQKEVSPQSRRHIMML